MVVLGGICLCCILWCARRTTKTQDRLLVFSSAQTKLIGHNQNMVAWSGSLLKPLSQICLVVLFKP